MRVFLFVLLCVVGGVLGAVPAAFDCGMREMALDFVSSIQSGVVTKWQLEAVADALSGSPEAQGCNLTAAVALAEARERLRDDAARSFEVTVAADATFYVDAVRGSDSNAGTETSPWRTIAHGVAETAGKGPATLLLRQGTFHVTETINIGPDNSGLTIQNYPGEQVWVSGGQDLGTLHWEPFNVSNASQAMNQVQDTNCVFDFKPGPSVWPNGTTPDADSCRALCEANYTEMDGKGCNVYTWHDKNQGAYANMCVFRFDGATTCRAQSGHWSGWREGSRNIWVADVTPPVGGALVQSIPGLRVGEERAIFARYPNADPQYGWGSTLTADSWMPPTTPTNPDTEVNPSYPVRNTTTEFNNYQAGIGGPCEHFSPPIGYWCGNKTQGGGAFTFRVPSGFSMSAGKLPHAPYKSVDGANVYVWRPSHWASWAFLLDPTKSDSAKGSYVFSKGGFQGARGNNNGAEMWISGVFEELDYPREYYFDRNANKLYYFHNETAGVPPPASGFVDPVVYCIFNIQGSLPSSPVRDVTIQGIGIRDAQATVFAPHSMPSGGDWALQRWAAIQLEVTERVTLQGLNFTNNDGNAVSILAYNRNATVRDTEIYLNAASGVISLGNCSGSGVEGFGPDCTAGNMPYGNLVERVFGHEIGFYEKQISIYFEAKSAFSTIRDTVFFNGPRAGININDMAGGGLLVDRTFLANTCRESGDHGPINSWNRQVYLTNWTGVPTAEPVARNQVHQSFFIANYNSQEAVDNDDGSSFWETSSSFFPYSGNGMKNDFGGSLNTHSGNVYAYIGRALGIVNQTPQTRDEFANNYVVLTGGDVGNFACSGDAMPIMANNSYFTQDGALSECKQTFKQWQSKGNEPGSEAAAWPEPADILARGKAVLGL